MLTDVSRIGLMQMSWVLEVSECLSFESVVAKRFSLHRKEWLCKLAMWLPWTDTKLSYLNRKNVLFISLKGNTTARSHPYFEPCRTGNFSPILKTVQTVRVGVLY